MVQWLVYKHSYNTFCKNGPTSVSFSFIFGLFQTNVTFLQQINVKKYPSSIQCWHLNPQPFDHESPNITTTPGQPNLTQVSI